MDRDRELPGAARVLTNSRDIKRRLEADGWHLQRTRGSHLIFDHAKSPGRVVLPQPKKDLPVGTVRDIYKTAGWPID